MTGGDGGQFCWWSRRAWSQQATDPSAWEEITRPQTWGAGEPELGEEGAWHRQWKHGDVTPAWFSSSDLWAARWLDD